MRAVGPEEEAGDNAPEGGATGVDVGGKVGDKVMGELCATATDRAGSDRAVRAVSATADIAEEGLECFRRDNRHSGSRNFEALPKAFASPTTWVQIREAEGTCRS